MIVLVLFHVRKIGVALVSVLALTVPSVPANATTSVKIAIAYDLGGRGDHGINDAVAKGVDFIKKKYGLTSLSVREMVTNGTESDREYRLQFLANAKYNLVLAVGAGYSQAMSVVSQTNPNTQFAMINDASVANLNVSDMVFDNAGGAYLAGVLAGCATKKNKIGFISPTPLAKYLVDFQAGVASIKPKAVVISQIVDNAPSAATKALAAAGSDIIFSEWSSTSEVQDTVAGLTTTAHPIFLVGVSPDQYFLLDKSSQKILLGAVTKRLDIAAEDVMVAALKGQRLLDVLDATQGIFGHMYTVKDGGESMALTKLGSPYAAKVSAALTQLKNGKVKLP